MRILACDPGDTQSAFVYYESEAKRPVQWWLEPNDACRKRLVSFDADVFVVEYTPPYAMKTKGGHAYVPNQVVLTAIEIGRFVETWEFVNETNAILFSRLDVKKHLLGRTNGNDTMIRQAIMDRFGGTREKAIGRKATPGPLFGMKADQWAAFAVAISYYETEKMKQGIRELPFDDE